MLNEILQQYVPLCDFLSKTLGTDYTVSLYDLSESTPIPIVNVPQTNIIDLPTLNSLIEKATDNTVLNQIIINKTNHSVWVSCMLIYQKDKLIGILCITFDDIRYRNVCEQMFQLCRPNACTTADVQKNNTHAELLARDAAIEIINKYCVSASRLNSDERLKIIKKLDDNGIFLLKGAVKDVATVLECSPASIYRYLSQIHSNSFYL